MATIELTEENLENTVQENDIVVIDFWAEWCGPCKSFGPIFEKVSEENEDIVFGKVDTDAQQGLAQAFQVRSIPMTVIFREQIPVFGQPGLLPEKALRDLITQVKGLDMEEVREEYQAQIAEQEAKQAQA